LPDWGYLRAVLQCTADRGEMLIRIKAPTREAASLPERIMEVTK
jgi:hypothetical protein